ncbi:hypothetical protein DPMN_188222 [Dreissena polymorpha]|uniref:Uncharacterized protein n=1 Tax=Dreissena polymorpha TaxID=45954 RepID=A0A9D4IB54_DREPO|nr:hypothetical protein DPMN_188222 [Dreissena polymorpha]
MAHCMHSRSARGTSWRWDSTSRQLVSVPTKIARTQWMLRSQEVRSYPEEIR